MSSLSQIDFIEGRVEQILTVESVAPKILIIGLHGDEVLAPATAHAVYNDHNNLMPYVDYICGNPLATQKQIQERYIEKDLNRCFGDQHGSTYEDNRAIEIKNIIDQRNYDYILDLHTTKTESGKFALIAKRNEAVDNIIKCSLLNKVVVLPDGIVREGLIGSYNNSISIEYQRNIALEFGVRECVSAISRLVSSSRALKPKIRNYYIVDKAIPKDEDPGIECSNFTLCSHGYYPILFGNNNYRSDPNSKYLGFAASVVEEVLL